MECTGLTPRRMWTVAGTPCTEPECVLGRNPPFGIAPKRLWSSEIFNRIGRYLQRLGEDLRNKEEPPDKRQINFEKIVRRKAHVHSPWTRGRVGALAVGQKLWHCGLTATVPMCPLVGCSFPRIRHRAHCCHQGDMIWPPR